MTDLSPMVLQYQGIKSQHKDKILFFRLGDFYEMFNEDAVLASRELNLTLTGRGADDNRMPMCGIPYHAAQGYIAKLLDKGYKVAICEQVEDPKLAKGVVKREVIKIYTPGTVIEESYLNERVNNYLLVVSYKKGKFGLVFGDASTGEFRATEVYTMEELLDEVNRIAPREILFSDMWQGEMPFNNIERFKDKYDAERAKEHIKEFFKIKTLDVFGIGEMTVGLSAAAAMLDYLEETQKADLGHINRISPYLVGDYMLIDSGTRRNLELIETARDRSFKGSLLWVLDHCKTNMGSRLLRNLIQTPSMELKEIEDRLDAVEELKDEPVLRAELGEKLAHIFDIERLTAKIASSAANARDLIALKESLAVFPQLKELIANCKAEALQSVLKLSDLNDLKGLIDASIVPDPPYAIKEGGIIRDGYDAELDETKKIMRGGKSWVAELENAERLRSGIKSLKVGFNRVFGYYIEVTAANINDVPQDYIRKQTLTNCERFITPELKEKEALILNAEGQSFILEYELFCKIRDKAAAYTNDLQQIAKAVAQLDVVLSLSDTAAANNYCRPRFHDAFDLVLKNSRHPVVEKMLGEHNFVPNDVSFGADSRFLLITGPNMAGKSTYMRQAALIVIMAQMGSFVPAKEATLPLTDRIFTRIGAMDDIYAGQSTFMVEMTETANILNNATGESLIILDEIGRGTATFDGMSIAAAVAEYIHHKIGAKTLFATHYHEITQLADKHSGMQNLNIAVREEGDHITFLHKIIAGPADRSYGIQVAKLAGLPKEVVSRAKEIYNTLEMVENDLGKSKKVKTRTKKTIRGEQDQVSLF